MLRIPSFRKIGTVTCYEDDAVWFRFYLLPSMPTIRRDENGRPVFLLTKYHISDQAREEDESLPRGGGYMNFDVQFAVDEAAAEAARVELQKWVNDEYSRRRGDPEYSRQPEYAGVEPPTVELADPLLSGGTVTMLTTQAEQLVTDRFAEAPASLVSGSTAVFSVDLTEHGAEFMHDLMVDKDGTGTVDLTPVQVIYDLKMWARLPPVTITVTGKSERIHETLLKVSETNRDNPCTPSEVETYRENGISSSNLKETGSVEVHVNKGDATVPDDVLQSLQDYALDLFDTMVKERFLVPADEDQESLEFDGDDPGIGEADPGWGGILYRNHNFGGEALEVREDIGNLGNFNDRVRSVRVRRGHRLTLYQHANFGGSMMQIGSSRKRLGGKWEKLVSSVKIWRPPTSRYKVRKTVNHATMNLEIKIDRSQVVEWPTGGQATLETFFAGASAEELSRHVVELFATDFDTLGVTVRALVDFENEPIQAVEVQTEYSATDSTGEKRTTPGPPITFRAGETEPAKFDPTIIGGEREYSYRYRVFFDDGTSTDYTEWETTTNRALNISVADPGRLELEVSGASLNWEVVRAVTAKLSYSAAQAGVEPTEKTYELTQLNPVRKWDQRFNRQLAGEIEAQITYHLIDDKVIEGDSQMITLTDTLFVVPPPQVDILNVSLVPSGDWNDVAQAVVSLEYDAGDGRIFDKVFRFSAIDQFAEWAVLLRDPSRRSFRYKTLVAYKSGESDESPWKTETGDQAILIRVKEIPKLRVNVLANLVDFERTPAVTVTLSYGSERKTLSFTGPTTTPWVVPLQQDGSRDYTYEITWHPTDGDSITSGPTRTADTEIFIARARLPQRGLLEVIVRGFAVDFATTPFVDVALVWSDVDRQERKTITLSQSEPNATWSVDIGDRSQRQYRYEITYNLANGTRVDGASGTSEDPVISVTPYQP